MLVYKLNDTDTLLKFITSTPEFLNWETMICRFSTTSGLNMDMNTKVVDASHKVTFIELQFLLPTIKNFYNSVIENNYTELNLEIKLRLPEVFKNKYDPNNDYAGFYLNATSDNLVAMISTTHLENTRDAGLQPITSWEEYVMSLYYEFTEKVRKHEI